VRARWRFAGCSGLALLFPGIAFAAEGLNLNPRWSLVLTNLVTVLLLIWPVNRLLIAPLVRILQQREARTAGSSGEATALRAEAAAERGRLAARRDQARRQASDRRNAILARGKTAEQGVLDAARTQASESLAQVRSSIATELEQVRSGLRSEARALAQLAAERILGRAL
jgi:F-type H+-transporting ATPase subunit b